MRRTALAAVALIFLFPMFARPEQQDALATVQVHVDNVLKVLRNPGNLHRPDHRRSPQGLLDTLKKR
jgi:hypothetical protein